MRGRGLTVTPAVLGIVGLGLLVFESVQALRSIVLGTVGTTLLFVGLGLIVVAGAMLLVSVSADDPIAVDAEPETVAPEPAPTEPAAQPDDPAAGWTELCRTEVAGRLDAGELKASVRRGATLVVYEEGVLIGVGKTEQRRTWADLTAIAAQLGGSRASITFGFSDGDGSGEARFTGKNGDLAPAATALVSAAPDHLVDVTYT